MMKITIISTFITPLVSPLGPNRCMMNPPGPLACNAQIVQRTKNTIAIAKVMLKSAFAPRNSGPLTFSMLSGPVGCPKPTVPTPGIRPNQFENRIRMKIVAKNQNVFFTS